MPRWPCHDSRVALLRGAAGCTGHRQRFRSVIGCWAKPANAEGSTHLRSCTSAFEFRLRRRKDSSSCVFNPHLQHNSIGSGRWARAGCCTFSLLAVPYRLAVLPHSPTCAVLALCRLTPALSRDIPYTEPGCPSCELYHDTAPAAGARPRA